MLQKIFYFEKLNLWDKVSVLIYIIATVICGYFFYFNNSNSSNRKLLLFYTLGTQLLLYLLNYKSLRNLTVYLIWFLIALGHLFFYFELKDNLDLFNVRGHAATGLRNTIILLLLYQGLRIISIKTQNQELVAPSKGGSTDIFENRKITFIDYLLFAVYFATAIILNT